MKLHSDDLKKMRAFQTRKRTEKEHRRLELFKKAKTDFQRIVAMIIEKYQPTRLYQWGSLLDHKKFREYSDIDIIHPLHANHIRSKGKIIYGEE